MEGEKFEYKKKRTEKEQEKRNEDEKILSTINERLNIDKETLINNIKDYPNSFKQWFERYEFKDTRYYGPIIALILELVSDGKVLEDFKKSLEGYKREMESEKLSHKPLKNLRILEVGGGQGRIRYDLLSDLGASETYNIDPEVITFEEDRQMQDKIDGELKEKGIYLIKDCFSKENYEKLLEGKKFHVTYSVELLSYGSSLLPPGADMDLSINESIKEYGKYLSAIADATVDGGISIHIGDRIPIHFEKLGIPIDSKLLKGYGLELIFRLGKRDLITSGDVYVFRKVKKESPK